MRTLILLSIVALACSQGFLRNLQDGETPANTTNGTNGTMPANTSNSSLGTIAPVDVSGNWTVVNTNCTMNATDAACTPSYLIVNNGTANDFTVLFAYPAIDACGVNSGQNLSFNVISNAGVWFDNTTGSILMGSIGVYNPINQSIYLLRPDFENPAGGFCYEDLMNANASNASNATVAATNTSWEGAWQASAVSLAYDGAQCCIPDVPVLLHEDNTTNTVFYALRAPNCTACGQFATEVLFGTNMLQEGFIIDNSTYAAMDVSVVFYPTLNGTLIAVYPTCAIEFTSVMPTTC